MSSVLPIFPVSFGNNNDACTKYIHRKIGGMLNVTKLVQNLNSHIDTICVRNRSRAQIVARAQIKAGGQGEYF